ncbi:uncharacterized protein BDR25DRAFT_109641 [Lindgomyces ingoldianus]|uniref:Uncharacterized protein n=1 Tax=Lindgomyces ingoldianus TaxID=673940 RepID=A0ACB6R644_9PLEO|nr:uncharacterized protein BDR25DRAFT_109641 [Lindgomyces ingoldianus]KAF2474542.1 hypothetical protein BDR25DRAFT_109641 [Lindgomyces ingoldianus]
MTTYCYYPYQEQPQVVWQPNTFGYLHYDRQRSKTPTSLINHTGLSPGPLSTPPQSRNPSQPPEQAPDQMIWDDASGSPSNSPTSVNTPDLDSFEVEMLDATDSMRNLCHASNEMGTTQVSPVGVEAPDMMFLSDQALQDAYNATIVAIQQQQQQQFTLQFNTQNRPSQEVPLAPPSPFNHLYSQGYTNQPPRQDPWTSQRPSQNSNVPQSDAVVFDLETDPVDYGAFINPDVGQWTMNVPDYLISPTESAVPPLDGPNRFQGQSQIQSPVEMSVSTSSSGADSQSFINYNSSSPLFTESYITEPPHFPLSPGNSTITQPPRSPCQAPVSPFLSMPSPGGSEGMFSSQYSDPRIMLDPYPVEQFDAKPAPPPSPVQTDPSPIRTIPEITYDSPDTETPLPQPAGKGQAGRPGGRALGTHLEPKVAKAAHDMRKIVACWHCVLQRDKCGPGDTCERCLKRSQRPNSDCGLGCSRVKLVELVQCFLPSLYTQMHEDAQLTHFVSQHIRQWGNAEITIYMTCGQNAMPRIPVKVYEFLPKTQELLRQFQYFTDPVTHKMVRVEKSSPAVGMVHINHNEEKKYDKYINDIIDHHLGAFGELCWMEDDNDFQHKLFMLMMKVKPRSDEEVKLLREVFRLIIATFIMSHTLSIAEETKHASLSKLHSYPGPSAYVENFTSPRMTNRQLKYFFARLQKHILTTVLNKLQQMFKSSRGCDKWMAAFIAVIGMCMAHEDQQKTLHLVMETKSASEGANWMDSQARADFACREIDARMGFIAQIFRWKFNRKCNPLRNAEHDWDREVGFGDANSVEFVRGVAQLVKENIDFLQMRQAVSISHSNQTKYTSRLVAQFLLSFWLPS